MKGKSLKTRKGKLYYQVGGTGDALLMLHGNGESSDIFAKQFPFFKKHFTVYALDTRGHGRSDLGVERLTFKQIAEDIQAGVVAAHQAPEFAGTGAKVIDQQARGLERGDDKR